VGHVQAYRRVLNPCLRL